MNNVKLVFVCLHEDCRNMGEKRFSSFFYCETTQQYWCEICKVNALIRCCPIQCQGYGKFNNCMCHKTKFLHLTDDDEDFGPKCEECDGWYLSPTFTLPMSVGT